MSGVSEQIPEAGKTPPEEDAAAAAPPSHEEHELAPEEESPEQVPARAIVPRWVQLVLLPISLLALWAVAKAAGKVLVIFIVAALIALILNPAVALLQRGRFPRGLAVLTVYLAFFLMLSGIGLLLANPISNQVESFSRDVPTLVKKANKSLADFQRTVNNDGIHFQFIKQGKTALQTIQEKLVKGSSSIVSSAGGVLTEVASASFDFVLVFVLSVYMLLYGPRIGKLIRHVMPDGDGTHADDYPTLVQNALARYVGGQLLFSVVMGATAGLAMYILGVVGIFPDGRKFGVAFAVFYGLMELVPYIGPIVGALPAVIVALVTDPISALWVSLTFVALQQLEGHIVAPQIFGHTLRINPLLVIFALLLGLQLHGVIGALIALPILSVLRETTVYLSRHVTFERWDRTDHRLL